jgi:hypothetical protein
MLTRRRFVPALASPLLLSRAEAQVTPDLFRFRPELEPLVALIERTPRDKCAEMAVERIRLGVSYRQFMAALFLAGIRNVNPRPPGFALHCVFIIHAAHLLGLEAPPDSRFLPLFFALDDFKKAQERDAQAAVGDYTMRPIAGALPSSEKAPAEFAAAMEAWDQDRAERAIVALARTRSVPEVFELLWRHATRDYRNIGHKAIYAANAFRTLQTIGEQHAEPVLRSLVLSLQDFGKDKKVDGYAFDDQCFHANLKQSRATYARLHPAWMEQRSDPDSVRSLLAAIRQAPVDEVCADVAARLVKGQAAAGSVWDAVHLAGAELQMRLPKRRRITGIHTVTSANGLHHCYLSAADPRTRHFVLLQAVGWLAQFQTQAATFKQDSPRTFDIAALEPATRPSTPFAELPAGPDQAAAQIMRLAADGQARDAFRSEAVRLTLAKADEVHYYKYLASIIEDVPLVSAAWQPHLLAATAFYVKGPADPDAAPMKRAREIMQASSGA